MQPVVLGLCPKRKNHPLCGWIFINAIFQKSATTDFVPYSRGVPAEICKELPDSDIAGTYLDFVILKISCIMTIVMKMA